MKAHQVQGFLVPQTDAFMGEYIPKSAERLAWISGFTGSAGMAVILVDKAVAFTDNRYAIQIMQEVDGGLYDYADMVQTRVHAWIKENGDDRDIIAYDPWLHTHAQIKNLEDNDVSLKAVETNLIDNVWIDQPRVPSEPVFSFSDETAGRTAGD
ncbi:MAG: aminopeptidase P family N-terminal domain-containing protein, partial [Flavobacteriales bacterium]|nr:aminopeptidase P family N-terminal domain-containing protein [Flavobacteriales bacterium]